MTVNYEVKSQLAKLLATEDIVVENREVMTAQFDVENRVLTLPMWKRASNVVYDMLVGHEVGHALYTPNEDPPKDIPHSFVNIVEDARIEKLMKRRYPGLSKSFYKGYNELSDQDFFCIDGQDLEKMNLGDRINLYYKIGNFVDIPFQAAELIFRDRCGKTETFEDVCDLAREIYTYCKEGQKSESENIETPPTSDKGESSNVEQPAPPSSGGDQQGDSERSDDTEYEEDIEQEIEEMNEGGEPEATTDKAFEDGISELNGMDRGIENVYVEVPKVKLENIIIDHTEVQQTLDLSWQLQSMPMEHTDKWTGEVTEHKANFDYPDQEFQKFKKSAQREVNYLVKEFECKKSADAYARATVSKTGVLDCTKLHTYKYNEDLFRKISVLPDGQNHGLIFILDWSGSMADCLLDTVKQLLNLVWFCNKCNIPFEVYAFTNSFYWKNEEEREQDSMDWENGKLFVHKDFNLINFLSSRAKRKDLEKQILNLWRVAFQFKRWCYYDIPQGYGLSGTPLNESLISLYQIIPQFKKNNDLQKVQCVIMTDGEANHLPFCRSWYSERFSEWKEGTSNLHRDHSYLRNRKTGHTYKIGDYYHQFTECLLTDMKQTFPDTNFIGIRISGVRDVNNMIKRYESVNVDEKIKQTKKDKFISINNSGYSSYFIMVDQALNQDTEFEVEEGASKAKIKSAFAKNLKSKALNKKVLSQFMELVC